MKESKFKLGQPVLYAFIYGDPPRYNGEPRLAFITEIEYIESRDSYLYTVGMESSFNKFKPAYNLIGEHLVFSTDELDKCKVAIENHLKQLNGGV